MATICAKNQTIVDPSCPGEAEWFNRMAATVEGAARNSKIDSHFYRGNLSIKTLHVAILVIISPDSKLLVLWNNYRYNRRT